LGDGEQGSRAALPTWIFFMRQALAGTPRFKLPAPDGIVTARISPVTGLLASADDPNAIMEKFIEGNLPKQEGSENQNNQNPLNDGEKPLF
jgi:penicillin-binding protein 1A